MRRTWRDTLEAWLTVAVTVLCICAAAIRHARRASARRRMRRHYGAY